MKGHRPMVIVNRAVGSSALESLKELLGRYPPSFYELTVTESARHARRCVQRALRAGCHHLIAAGGDGTLRSLLPLLAREGRQYRLGIVPLGTFNNVSRSLGLPCDPERALATALFGRPKATDLGRANATLFTESAGVGYVAEAWAHGPEQDSQGFGRWLRGIAAASAALLTFEPQPLQVEIEGQSWSEPMWNVTVVNCPLFAHNVPIAPRARLDDGLLDVCLFPLMSRWEFLHSLPAVSRGEHLEQVPGLIYRRARRIKILSETELTARIDNSVERCDELDIQAVPAALRINTEVGEEVRFWRRSG